MNKLLRFFGRKDNSSFFDTTASDMFVKYRTLQDRLKTRCNVPILYKYVDDNTGNSAVDRLPECVLVSISSSAMYSYVSGLMQDARIPGRDVVAMVVTFCHETEHAMQIEKAHDKDADPIYAMRYLIDTRNRFLYDAGGSRYWHNTSEIESERKGVLDAGRELHKMFPDVEPHICTQAVEEYVNGRCFVGTGKNAVSVDYFIRPQTGYPDMPEIRRLFDTAARQGYPFCYPGRATDTVPQRDEFLQIVHFQGKRSPWWEVMSKLNQAQTERESIQIVYAISLLRHPEDIQNYPSLAKIQDELHPDVMFGEGFLERAVAYDKARGADVSYADNAAKLSSISARDKPAGKRSVRELPVIEGNPSDFDIDFLNR